MSEDTGPEVRSLVRVVFGGEAAETIAHRPGAAMRAAERTDEELNTLERTLKTVIRQTMGNRAGRIREIAEIMTIETCGARPRGWRPAALTQFDASAFDELATQAWVEPTPGEYYSGTFVKVRKWTKAQRDLIKKPLPR